MSTIICNDLLLLFCGSVLFLDGLKYAYQDKCLQTQEFIFLLTQSWRLLTKIVWGFDLCKS